MADNPARSFRTRDFGQDAEFANDPQAIPGQAGADPLAELARLIGHTDPFADFGRGASPAVADTRAPADWQGNPQFADPSMVQRDYPAPTQTYVHPAQHPAPFHAQPNGGYAAEPHDQDAYQDAWVEPEMTYDPAYAAPNLAPAADPRPPGYDAVYASAHPGHPVHDPAMQPRRTPAGAGFVFDERDALYDDPPRKRWLSGLRTAIMLVLLALVGTAAAFGYRTLFSDTEPSGAPPVIRADATPTKVAPGADTAATQANKPIQDRLAAPGQGERVVSREEQPILLNDGTGTTSPPNATSPFGPQVALGTNPPAPGIVPGGGVIGTEPKRIRTVLIRPDQPEVPVQQQAATTPPPRIATTAPRAAPDPAPAPRINNAPLSLNPTAPSIAPPTRTATAPANIAPAPAVAGGYVVQLSSRRSEADALSTFQVLQHRFPNQLGSWQPIIRRADLGSRGIFYRTLVGPFGAQGEAANLCQSLKNAGGDCLILKN